MKQDVVKLADLDPNIEQIKRIEQKIKLIIIAAALFAAIVSCFIIFHYQKIDRIGTGIFLVIFLFFLVWALGMVLTIGNSKLDKLYEIRNKNRGKIFQKYCDNLFGKGVMSYSKGDTWRGLSLCVEKNLLCFFTTTRNETITVSTFSLDEIKGLEIRLSPAGLLNMCDSLTPKKSGAIGDFSVSGALVGGVGGFLVGHLMDDLLKHFKSAPSVDLSMSIVVKVSERIFTPVVVLFDSITNDENTKSFVIESKVRRFISDVRECSDKLCSALPDKVQMLG